MSSTINLVFVAEEDDTVLDWKGATSTLIVDLKKALLLLLRSPPDLNLVLHQNAFPFSDDVSLASLNLTNNDVIYFRRLAPQPAPLSELSLSPAPAPASSRAPPPTLTLDFLRQTLQSITNNRPSMPNPPAHPPPQPQLERTAGIMPEIFQQALQQATITAQQTIQQQQRSSAEQVRAHFMKHPEALSGLREKNKEMAQAIIDNDLPTLRKMLDDRETELRVAAEHRRRVLSETPFGEEAQRIIEQQIQSENIKENLENALEHNPETFARVSMLYIDCKVNGVPIKAFVDCGAQITVMSSSLADKCGLLRLIDRSFQGKLVGVGTSNMIGKIHLADLQIGQSFFHCSFTIIENDSSPFLLGLDMLRKHQAVIDLKSNTLQIGGESVSFLAEKDLPNETFLRDSGSSLLINANDCSSSSSSTVNETSSDAVEAKVVEELIMMGFDRDAVIEALKIAGGNPSVAVSILEDLS